MWRHRPDENWLKSLVLCNQMKRVAILTTHRANNFGAVLQAYSLVMACRELGADAELLDWRHPDFERSFHRAWKMHRNPITAIKYLWWHLVRETSARKAFDDFRRKIPMSRPICSRTDLESMGAAYDSYVVGSDQVWNPRLSAWDATKFDRALLLDFVRGKPKNAYAASIGVKEITPETIVPEFKSAWQSFDHISMREEAGAEFVEKTIGKKVPTVLDPVLLHDADWWMKNTDEIALPHEPYLLIYNVQQWRKDSDWLVEQAYEYAWKNNLKVVKLLVPGQRTKWTKDTVSVGPNEFVRYIAGASAVFANSFHASAFASIFKKPLYVHRASFNGSPTSRFDTLAEMTGCKVHECARHGGDALQHYDFTKNNVDRWMRARAESLRFLEDIVHV